MVQSKNTMPEPIEVIPSEDNGNVPIEAPNESPSTEQGTEQNPEGTVAPEVPNEQQPVQPTESDDNLFELPDGRKVDAATLSKEWQEKFYPEFTRRSQKLAELTKGTSQINNDNKSTEPSPYQDPNYIPQSYEEIIQESTKRALELLKAEQQQEAQQRQAVEDLVVSQITELKTADPSLNENALFQHAIKYGFQDLKAAYTNMKDMQAVVKTTQQQTVKNIKNRASEPIATQPGRTAPTTPDPTAFQTARDYLRTINN